MKKWIGLIIALSLFNVGLAEAYRCQLVINQKPQGTYIYSFHKDKQRSGHYFTKLASITGHYVRYGRGASSGSVLLDSWGNMQGRGLAKCEGFLSKTMRVHGVHFFFEEPDQVFSATCQRLDH